MITTIRWGILATGRMAGVFAEGVKASRYGVLGAVGSRNVASARAFADQFGVGRAHGSYAELLADDEIDAVYIATPHPVHAEWAIRAAEAGKHVLCEKPAGMNHAEAMVMVETARERGVFFMEAFMYRCHPQTRQVAELISGGRIGEVRLIQASFGFDAKFDPASRAFAQALGGGGILDVGCYPVSMARLLAGAARGQPWADPIEVTGAAHVGKESRVDEWAVATLRFEGGLWAQISAGVKLQQENVVRVFGSAGSILVPDPWLPSRDGGPGRIVVSTHGNQPPEEISVGVDRSLYALEVDAFAEGVAVGMAPWPAMSPADTLGNMRVLDLWRAGAGLVYDGERPAAAGVNRLAGRPISGRKERQQGAMRYGTMAGIEKPLSRLIFGADNQTDFPYAAVMFDDFVERGGTVIDTAYVYGRGVCESMVGHWLRARGVREEIVLLGKGAHTPHCFPDAIGSQLSESLGRLQTDYVDLYLMHRDNVEVPVGEFMDALHSLREAGRIRAYGVSNWSIRRIEEANRYAEEKGIPGLAGVSNNLSLARMVQVPWAGCETASDAETRQWLAERQMPLLAWSSQAHGFFTGRVARGSDPSAMVMRCWGAEDNFLRLDRVNELARRRGCSPVSVTLAWVLQQPFPTYALIGCRTVAEMRSTWEGLAVELTEQERDWLDLK
jgi:predicted dehydrogenase/aryl-alcohol dehydrogenase-like predicted oxidoreductase